MSSPFELSPTLAKAVRLLAQARAELDDPAEGIAPTDRSNMTPEERRRLFEQLKKRRDEEDDDDGVGV